MSIEAAILGVLVMGLMLVASSPFGASGASAGARVTAVFSFIALNVVFAVLTLLKGKLILGTAAVFIAPLGWIGALRLAKPYSPWAHWFYDPGRGRAGRSAKRERKRKRATRRFETGRLGRVERRLVELIGGRFDKAAPDTIAGERPAKSS
jgi:hypothetical protein